MKCFFAYGSMTKNAISIVNVFDLTQMCFVWNPKIDSLTYKSIGHKNLKNNYLNLLALDFVEKRRFCCIGLSSATS